MVLGKNFQKTEDFGGKGVGRSEGMKDKCKVGSLNIFCIQTTYLPLLNIGSIALATEICAGPHHRLLRRQHCSSLCSQSEGYEHVANIANALAHDLVGFSVRAWPPQYSSQYSSPSLCKQSELQCWRRRPSPNVRAALLVAMPQPPCYLVRYTRKRKFFDFSPYFWHSGSPFSTYETLEMCKFFQREASHCMSPCSTTLPFTSA